ncbi:hypothetical protein DY037_05520 [Apilactobacillus micheneri]|uniref:hypothetical protein n=1 Tax=Apilactobacillus micheneri TaxID=1899430 RepID=UPI001129A46C|nr:hypothetical protein [Apilactobacillus micheneri]TPR49240.1 hypothetical protein DY037_05520 [Apilactobacillus micheneri]
MENKQSSKHPMLSKAIFLYVISAYLLAGFRILSDQKLSLSASIGIAIIPLTIVFIYGFILAKVIEQHGILKSAKVALLFGTIFWIINLLYLL